MADGDKWHELEAHGFPRWNYGTWRGSWLGITFTPLAGNEPNWFRRVMTSWAFGVKWAKVNNKETGDPPLPSAP